MPQIITKDQLERALGRSVPEEEWREYLAAHAVTRPPHETAERRLGPEGERRA